MRSIHFSPMKLWTTLYNSSLPFSIIRRFLFSNPEKNWIVIFGALVIPFFCSLAWAVDIITTVAGGEVGDGSLATLAITANPAGVCVDSAGNLYISDYDNHRIRKVDASTGKISTVAGTGIFGFGGDGGEAVSALIRFPFGICLDNNGNLYIADSGNHRIRKVDAWGKIGTVAGNGIQGYSGDGDQATSASLKNPYGVCVDSSGNIYIADLGNNVIRKVDATTKIITTVAGDGTQGDSGDDGPAISAKLKSPYGVCVDSYGNLYIADTSNHRIRKVDATTKIITTVAGTGESGFSGDDGPATSAKLYAPGGLSMDSVGNLYIADSNNNRIRRVDYETKKINTVAGTVSPGFSGDGGLAASAALYCPQGVFVDSSGNIYIGDSSNNRIRKVDTSGYINTVAGNGNKYYFGNGIPATSASLSMLQGVAMDNANNLFIVDSSNNRIRKVEATTGIITTVAGTGSTGFSGDEGLATNAALYIPSKACVDNDGNLYVADTYNHRVRKVDATTKIISTVAGTGTSGFSGDDGLANVAKLSYPLGVYIDNSNHLFIADSNNNRIRQVNLTTGIITTVAGNGTSGYSGDEGLAISAQLYTPADICLDSDGNLYIADKTNQRIRKVDANTKYITTVAGTGTGGYGGDGGQAINAKLNRPTGICFDSSGNLFIADRDNYRVRKIDAITKNITTVAGVGVFGFTGDEGPSSNANLAPVECVAIDSVGNLYMADSENRRVRKVTFSENAPPTLTSFASYLDTANINTEVEITFADIAAQGNESDDVGVTAFYIEAVSTGILKIGTSSIEATRWHPTQNRTVDSTHHAYWTPSTGVTGAQNAFKVTAYDGLAKSSAAIQAQVNVVTNAPPTLTAFTTHLDTTNEDTEVEITSAEIAAQGNEADADGDILTFRIKAVSTGTLKIGASSGAAADWNATTNCMVNSTNNAYWMPAANANGALNAFTVVAYDGISESTPAVQATVSVTAVNDPPTLTAFTTFLDTVNEDTEVEITSAEIAAQGNEADLEGDTISFRIKAVSTGTLKIGASSGAATDWNATTNCAIDATNKAYWTPAANANGTLDAFTVVAYDGIAESTPAVQATVSVTAVNDPPTLTAFTSYVDAGNEDMEIKTYIFEITAQGDEADVDGSVVAFHVKAVSSGTLLIGMSSTMATAWNATSNYAINSTYSAFWTPAANANGILNAFTVVAYDGTVESATPVQVTMNVTAVNDAPTISSNPSVTANEDANKIFIASDFNFSDVDTGDSLQAARIVIAPVTGILWVDADSNGSVNGAESAIGNNTTVAIADITANRLKFKPALNENGSPYTTFTYQVRDGMAFSTGTGTMTVNVTPVNDAPSFTKGGDQTVIENAGAQSVANWATSISAGPPDEATQTLAFTVSNNKSVLFSTQPAINSAGDLTYTSAANASGSAIVSVTLSDNGGTANGGVDASAPQTFTITVNALNAAPVANNDIAETYLNHAIDVNVLNNDTDADNDRLVIVEVTQGAHGTVIHDGTKVTYTPESGYTGSDSFQYRANDNHSHNSTATVTVSVYPLVVVDAGSDVAEEIGKGIPLRASATGGGLPPTSIRSAAVVPMVHINYAYSWGILSGSDTRLSQFSSATVQDPTFTPTLAGTYIVQCTATARITPPATDTVRITVTHRPVVQDISANSNENSNAQITLIGSDADGEPITYQIQTNPGAGALSDFNAQTGTLTYTPIQHFAGVDTFTYTATDGLLTSLPKIVTVTVANSVNDPPIAYPVAAETTMNSSVLLQLLSSDPDGYSARIYRIVANPSHGVLSDLNMYGGTVLYTPSMNYYGGDSFTYVAVDVDSGGVSAAETVTITVKYVEGALITTPTPTPTDVPTDTPTPLPASTETPTPTNTVIPTPTNTVARTPTPLNTATSTPTLTPTYTVMSTFTFTPANTATYTPPSTPRATNTAIPTPTNTATGASTPEPANTAVSTPTLPSVEDNTPTPTTPSVTDNTPTPTTTPTPVLPTPTPIIVVVTDNAAAMVDISNATDWDSPANRVLSMQWDLNLAGIDITEVNDVHIYVQTDKIGEFAYLGRTASGMATGFDWKAKSLLIHSDYRQGPAFGHSYRFRIFALTKTGDPLFYGPFDNAGPVDYRPAVIVTDDPESGEDLSNGVDEDAENARSLAIHWTFDAELVPIPLDEVKEYHVYVRVNREPFQYLGTTASATIMTLDWKQTTSGKFNEKYWPGPQYGNAYQFKVYALTKSKIPLFYGPYPAQGPVKFQPGD